MKNKSYIKRLICGGIAAAMIFGASAAYAQEDETEILQTEDTQNSDTVERQPEQDNTVSASEQSKASEIESYQPQNTPQPSESQTQPEEKAPEKQEDIPETPDKSGEPEEPEEGSIELSVEPESTLYIRAESSATVYAQTTPQDASVSWSSSDESVASVSVSDDTHKADIKAVSEGKAEITASTDDGKSVNFYVNVNPKKTQSEKDNKDGKADNKPTAPTTKAPVSSVPQSSGYTAPSYTTVTTASAYKMPDNIPENVSLTVSSGLDKNTDAMLDALYSYDCYATFFVNPRKIYKQDNRVRRIVGQGHSLGVTLTAEQAKNSDKALKALKKANNNLTTVCGVPTRLVTVEGGSSNMSEETYKALKKQGYRIWDWDYASGSVSDAKKSAHALEDKMDTKNSLVVRINGDKNSAAMLTETLGYMNYVQIPTQAIADSDVPVCFADK